MKIRLIKEFKTPVSQPKINEQSSPDIARMQELAGLQPETQTSLEEDPLNIPAVAGGIAAVVASAGGITALMNYLKSKNPKAYDALTKLGSSASVGREKIHANPVNEGLHKIKSNIAQKWNNNSVIYEDIIFFLNAIYDANGLDAAIDTAETIQEASSTWLFENK